MLGIVALMVLLAASVVWLVFQHRPGWYRPVAADEPTIRRAQAESAAVADETSRNIVARQDFELQLADRMVNEWLAAMPVLWPQSREWLPPGVRDPAVSFDHDEMRVGVYVERNGWRVIVNVALTAQVSPDQEAILLSVRRVRGGSLPMPRSVTDSLRRRIHTEIERLRRDGLSMAESDGVEIDGPGTVNLTIRNRFIWPNGERPFRITHLMAQDGLLTIGMEPL